MHGFCDQQQTLSCYNCFLYQKALMLSEWWGLKKNLNCIQLSHAVCSPRTPVPLPMFIRYASTLNYDEDN